ncbi:MAG: SIMPL domain-containing protein [Candidatus Pacebacteria bacterium]|nr:SIMPL domain-containing protein [Candidatus Paceibacterota bacterium]
MPEDLKKGVLPKVIMGLFAAFLFVLVFYFLIAINAKIRETNHLGKEDSTVSISKTGTVYATPDLATVTITVTTEAKTADDALNQNREKAGKIVDFLKAQGIQDNDIKTIYYNLYPRYEYESSSAPEIYYPSGQRYLAGYDATESMEVKIRQLDKIGAITQGAVTSGATDVSGLTLTIENEEQLKTQARNLAIAKVKVEAGDIATGLGVKLGRIVGFTESNYIPPMFGYGITAESAKGSGSTPSAAPVATGENKVEITVTITYEIN